MHSTDFCVGSIYAVEHAGGEAETLPEQGVVEQYTAVEKKLHVMKKMTYKFFFSKQTPPPKKAKTTSYSNFEGKCQNKQHTLYTMRKWHPL